MEEATRIAQLPPYLFARIEKKIEEAKEKGVDLISLGIGDPDQPTPAHIIERLNKAAADSNNHQYPSSVGMLDFRKAVADWYRLRFGVEVDPAKEVVALIGSKEGLAHFSFCYLNPGDYALVPDPGYPVYGISVMLAGGKPYQMPLTAENNFLPDLNKIPEEVARKAKLLFLNYPNNPTGAIAEEHFFKEVIHFAKKYDLIVVHDAAYTEIAFEGYRPLSFLEVEGAKEVGIEFHSLSKSYNMTGWRIGWAVGRQEFIETLTRFKSNIDSGVFQAVQEAGIAALTGPQDCLDNVRQLYQERRDVAIEALNKMGWSLEKPEATIYVWAPVPGGFSSASFAEFILEKCGVVITPGTGYGENGEGYFRISLTVEKTRMKEAFQRMQDVLGNTVKFKNGTEA